MGKMIYLVDASHLLHRVIYTPQSQLTSSDGRPSGLVHGFLRSLAKIRRDTGHTAKFVICWDKSSSAYRQTVVPGYKGDRHTDQTDEDRKHLEMFNEGRKLLMNILGLFRIPTIQIHGVEADDIIAYLTRVNYGGETKVILSEDTDLFQLLQEDVKMYRPVRGEWWDISTLVEKKKLEADHWRKQNVMMQAMMGTHNNVSGIKGIGEVNAQRLSRLLVKNEEIKAKGKKNCLFLENQDTYLRNLKVVDLYWVLDHTDVGRQIHVEIQHVQSLNQAPYNFMDILSEFKSLELVKASSDIRHLEGSGLEEVLPLPNRS